MLFAFAFSIRNTVPLMGDRTPAMVSGKTCVKLLENILGHYESDLVESRVFFPKAALLLQEQYKTKSELSRTFLDNLDISSRLEKRLNVFDVEIKKLLEKEIPTSDAKVSREVLSIGDREFNQLGNLIGSMNKGIFESRDGRSIVKKVEGLDALTLKEMFWALQVENIGGPKLMGIFRNEKGEIYFEMEKIFHDEAAVTMKEIRTRSSAGSEFMDDFGDREFEEKLIDQMAKRFRDTTERKIIPSDSDFMVNSKGELRWLDVGLWTLPENPLDIIKQMEHYLQGMSSSSLSSDFSDKVFEEYFKLLKKSPKVSDEELEKYLSVYRSCPCTVLGMKRKF